MVLRLFGQGWLPGETLGNWNFIQYRRISAVKQCNLLRSSQSKNLTFFRILQSLFWQTIRWPKSLRTLGTRLVSRPVFQILTIFQSSKRHFPNRFLNLACEKTGTIKGLWDRLCSWMNMVPSIKCIFRHFLGVT